MSVPTNDAVMDAFGYAICTSCNGEHLAFSLLDGVCYWCRAGVERGKLPGQMREKGAE